MVTLTCPWCDETSLLAFTELTECEASFTCAECGTSVAFVDEPEIDLELAA
jgi:transcription elongation factor Elf1